MNNLILKYGQNIRVLTTEEKQWKSLTYMQKEGNPIGTYPFHLLCHIASAGPKGISGIKLASQSGQDPRSLFSRIKLLIDYGLVTKQPFVYKQANTFIYYHSTFEKEIKSAAPGGSEYTRKIYEAVRSSENQIILFSDLKRQVGFDPSNPTKFGKSVRRLEGLGFFKRVRARKPNENRQYYCVQLIRDIEGEDELESESDFDDDNNIEDEELINEEQNADDNDNDAGGETTPLGNSFTIAPEIENINKSSPQYSTSLQLYNRFYPLENQLYELVKQDKHGISTMKIVRASVGIGFYRIFQKVLDGFCFTEQLQSNQPPHLDHLTITRSYDFNSKVKFFRYFSNSQIKELQGQPPNPNWGTFKPISRLGIEEKSLFQLSKANYTPIGGGALIYLDKDGVEDLLWTVKQNLTDNLKANHFYHLKRILSPKIGRPRKTPLNENKRTISQLDENDIADETPVKKSRGRPKKVKPVETQTPTIKKGRGRSKKVQSSKKASNKTGKNKEISVNDNDSLDTHSSDIQEVESLIQTETPGRKSGAHRSKSALPAETPQSLVINSHSSTPSTLKKLSPSKIIAPAKRKSRRLTQTVLSFGSKKKEPKQIVVETSNDVVVQQPQEVQEDIIASTPNENDVDMEPKEVTPAFQVINSANIGQNHEEDVIMEPSEITNTPLLVSPHPQINNSTIDTNEKEIPTEPSQKQHKEGENKRIGPSIWRNPRNRSTQTPTGVPSPIHIPMNSTPTRRKSRSISTPTPTGAAYSIKAIKRQDALLETVKKNGGVTAGGQPLIKAINDLLTGNEPSKLDRKTLDRDIDSLISKGKIEKHRFTFFTELGTEKSRYLLIDKQTYPPEELIFKNIEKLKASKKAIQVPPKKLEVIVSDFKIFDTNAKYTKYRDPNKVKTDLKKKGRVLPSFENDKGTSTLDKLRHERDEKLAKRKEKEKKEMESKDKPSTPKRLSSSSISINNPLSKKVKQTPEEKQRARTAVWRKLKNKVSNDPLYVISRHRPLNSYQKELMENGQDEDQVVKEKSKRGKLNFDEIPEDIFFKIVLISRSVNNYHADWELIGNFFNNKHSKSEFKKLWIRVIKKYDGRFGSYKNSKQWEEIVLAGVRDKTFDVTKLKETDLQYCLDYWNEHDTFETIKTRNSDFDDIPSDSKDLEKEYEFLPIIHREENSTVENYFVSKSMIQRDLLSCQLSFTYKESDLNESTDIFKHPKNDKGGEEETKVATAMKSIIATETISYEPKIAANILAQFDDRVVTPVINKLEKYHLISFSGRNVRPRNFNFSNDINIKLQAANPSVNSSNAILKNSVVYLSNEFYHKLNPMFDRKKGVLISRVIHDSSFMCIFDLIARNQVDLVLDNRVPQHVLENGYHSRGFKPGTYFDVIVKKKGSNDDKESSELIEQDLKEFISDIPGGEKCSKIWIDINGNKNMTFWRLLTTSLLYLISIHPGITKPYIYNYYKELLTYDEIEDIIVWLKKRKALFDEKSKNDVYGDSDGIQAYWVDKFWYHRWEC